VVVLKGHSVDIYLVGESISPSSCHKSMLMRSCTNPETETPQKTTFTHHPVKKRKKSSKNCRKIYIFIRKRMRMVWESKETNRFSSVWQQNRIRCVTATKSFKVKIFLKGPHPGDEKRKILPWWHHWSFNPPPSTSVWITDKNNNTSSRTPRIHSEGTLWGSLEQLDVCGLRRRRVSRTS